MERFRLVQRVARSLKFVLPMECRHTDKLPEGQEWQYELKLDGYRVQAIKNAGDVRLFSRNGKSFEERFHEIADAVRTLRAHDFILDGEIIAIDEKGMHSFAALQRLGKQRPPMRFYVFDLLALNGKNLTKQPLRARRDLLRVKVPMPGPLIQMGPVFDGELAHILKTIRQFGFEGVVAKRLDSIYVPGEAPGTWLKHKVQQSEDFVVGGFIATGRCVDEILVGRRDGERLIFVESVSAGFVPASRRAAFAALSPLAGSTCPFVNLPEKKGPHRMTREKMKGVTWVTPAIVAEIAFNETTSSGHLRHAKFLRLREASDIRD